MIVFDRLWKTLADNNISRYKLIKDYGISKSQLVRMKKNANVTVLTIDRLCQVLHCRVEDIMEYQPDLPESPNSQESPSSQNAYSDAEF